MKNNLLASFVLVLIIGCAPMNANHPIEREFIFNTTVQVDTECMQKDIYDACLFIKNPVFHRGEAFSGKVGAQSDLTEWQTAGVQFSTPSDALENMNIKIVSVKKPAAVKENGKWKFVYNGAGTTNFEQVFTYYWASYATKLIENRTGHYWGKGEQIKIYLDDAYSGYTPSANSIHLQASTAEGSLALNAGVLMYYLGLANLQHAGNGQVQDLSADQRHRDCSPEGTPLRKSFCCLTADGCSKAIASGAAEYFASIVFPQAPTLGEAWVNSLEGMKICGVNRNLQENGNVTAGEAFSACAGEAMEGHPVALGTVYASMWWSVREKAKENFPDGDKEIDQLYQQHLVKIDGADDFLSVYQKILLTDRDLFGGKYSGYFREEFRRRGINVE